MTVTFSKRRFVAYLSIAGVVVAISMSVAAWSFYNAHRESTDRRREARAASVLVARAVCAENTVLETAVLTGAKKRTVAELERIHEFFVKFNAPVNAALRILEAPPCSKGAP